MTWFKVDDKLTISRKVLRIPRAHRVAAMGLWALAGSWCSSALTDGAVPAYMAEELGGTEELALHLVAVGLWHHAADKTCPDDDERCTENRPDAIEDGWWFHDWTQCNPLRTEVETERDKAKERMRQVREKRSPEVRPNKTRTSPNTDRTSPEVRLTPSRPVPSRPKRETPSSPQAATDAEFDGFWRAYPRKVGKGAAVKAYRTARRKVDMEAIAAALRVFSAAMVGRDPDKIPHPATWLNREPWHDDPDAIAPFPTRPSNTTGSFDPARAMARALALDAAEAAQRQEQSA